MAMSRRSRKPSSHIESMCIFNRVDDSERWVPIVIRKGNWITMQQTKKRKRSPFYYRISHFITAWKGRVKDFKIQRGKKMVLVQHVFMHREIYISPTSSLPRHRPNCKLSTTFHVSSL